MFPLSFHFCIPPLLVGFSLIFFFAAVSYFGLVGWERGGGKQLLRIDTTKFSLLFFLIGGHFPPSQIKLLQRAPQKICFERGSK